MGVALRHLGRPGRWTAPAVLVAAALALAAAISAPLITADGGLCEWPSGDSVYGESSVSVVPFGPTCTIGPDILGGSAVEPGDLTVSGAATCSCRRSSARRCAWRCDRDRRPRRPGPEAT